MTRTQTKAEQFKEGVSVAVWDWMEQHPISVPELFEAAIGKAVRRWLDDHEDEIIEAVAARS